MILKILLNLLIVCLLFNLIGQIDACGYESCPAAYDPTKVHLHIISHSHDDVGWGSTPDDYADNDVNPILSHVIESLEKNKNRKFVQVEIYYFKRWWQRQSQDVHTKVHSLVQSGQLSFANGGWCVNDEATTHYNQIIDQMTLGIEFLRREFGECAVPKLSWQIDPFGASREQANLYSMMGFDGHVTNRGNDHLKGEFTWNTSFGHSIFTTHLHNHYSAPDGFNFEKGNFVTEQNKHDKAKKLVELGKAWNADYGNKGHVLIPFGDDFQYKNAENWFSNLDKLIETVQMEHPEVHLFYSSPQCYIKAIKDLKPKLEIKSEDYHPYWTGYYSSRPVVKYLDRYVNNLLQAAKQLEVIAELCNTQSFLWEAKNQMGVLQHHDAITGTSPEGVMIDFKQRQISAIKATSSVIAQGLNKLTNKKAEVVHSQSQSQQPFIYTTVNISDFVGHLDSTGFAAIVYNPLGQEQPNTWIRVPVSESTGYKVLDSEGNELKKVSFVPISTKVRSLIGHHTQITHEIVFETNLPALGFNTYFIIKESTTKLHENAQNLQVNSDQDYVLKGKGIELVINHKNGETVSLTKEGKKHRLGQTFAYYGDGSSNSYEFCPKGPATTLNDSVLVHAAKYEGFSEVTQKIADWVWQTIRVYDDKNYVEFDWVVGPVSEGTTKQDKEVIIRFETDLKTNKSFYTDSNGRQMMQRLRSDQVRECHGTHQAIGYNYYPVTTKAALKDEQSGLELIALPDRSVGVSSLKDGELELMVHRRIHWIPGWYIMTDDHDMDGKGIVARGKLYLYLSDKEEATDDARQMSRNVFMGPIVAFNNLDSTVAQYKVDHNVQMSALKSPLPDNVHLLSLENWGAVQNNEVLVRFENFYDRNEPSNLSTTARVTVDSFANIKPEAVHKANLVVGNLVQFEPKEIVLEPQEISTLVYKVTKRDLSNSSVCSLKWEKMDQNLKLPQHAIVAGHNNDTKKTPLYVCRHKDVDSFLPGMFNNEGCHISNGGREMVVFNETSLNETEVLVAENAHFQWVPRHGGDPLPDNAFVAGTKAVGNIPLYIGRCLKNGGLFVGKIDEYLYYSHSGAQYKDCIDHEILSC